MKKLALFLFPLFVLVLACQKEGPIYYKTTGEGYVFYKTTKTPVSFKSVGVHNYPNRTGYGSQPYLEIYQTDENGFYRVRFIKRYNHVTPIYKGSEVSVVAPAPPWGNWDDIYFDKEFLQKQNKTFKIDTLWLENY
jgi:hypothetical protein